ncbi:MAG: hypothetical protein BWY42_01736 [Candidatus Omnitrophica bacterium ADurb.Bin277]|nr:MAG: hypothetical protein BWY42_01736 [Candidatus Omnitrophica bacterium ADurb.Bin277]
MRSIWSLGPASNLTFPICTGLSITPPPASPIHCPIKPGRFAQKKQAAPKSVTVTPAATAKNRFFFIYPPARQGYSISCAGIIETSVTTNNLEVLGFLKTGR